MASAAGPIVYWCHQCNVETRPRIGEDVLCTFCNQGFIEELNNTEFEPGVAFSALPFPFGNFLRMPSPASVGTTSRDRPMTNPPSPSSSSSSSSSSTTSSSTTQPQMQRTSSGQQQPDLQGHRPRILSGQLSGVLSLLEAMMQVIEEMNGSATEDARETEGRTSNGDHGVHASTHLRWQGSRDSSSGDTRPQTQRENEEGGRAPVPPMLILQGDMPNGVHTLEILVDDGQGRGPQMMPNQFRDYFMGPDLERLIQMLAESDPNRYGTPPAAKSAVEKLPKFKITEEHLASDAVQCAVCKDDFELEAEVQQMPCKHIYHPDCILPWLAQHNSCPMCRFELPTDDADYEARKGQIGSAHTNASPPEGLRAGMRTSSNLSEGQGGRAPDIGNVEVPQGSRPFTLWGMPAISGLNPFMRMEVPVRHEEMRQGQDASREDSTRDGVQWLFRLFSSGSILGQDNASNDEQSPESGNGRSPPNT